MGTTDRPVDGAAEPDTADFDDFARAVRERLGRVLVARYGVETGNDLCAEALAYAWSNWSRLRSMDNALGYLYRVAQSFARPHRRWHRRFALLVALPESASFQPDRELFDTLARLDDHQRVCVLLVHGYGWRYAEVAEVLGISVAAVTNHVHRGIARLRYLLEEKK